MPLFPPVMSATFPQIPSCFEQPFPMSEKSPTRSSRISRPVEGSFRELRGIAANAEVMPTRANRPKRIYEIGSALDCALMETIFHDVPFIAGFKPPSIKKMVGKVHAVLTSNIDSKSIDLSAIRLPPARCASGPT
jgi:hypothetical protein